MLACCVVFLWRSVYPVPFLTSSQGRVPNKKVKAYIQRY
ncbi:hypothetical protein CPS_4977 [Colwellia psychrerythraea 34H]|uniref:Uncharacterized protein n=1 Tax=Colwellia psychrerythraea (strain 34H / ATCC BAA-681) TaxID=167879 RepID=Q47UA7_COLP3|nr:hypothetical protein CPS_4977 [Colwellia psychrerythraea 34H]